MSTGLFGEYNHNIDAKGRLSVPAKFRDELGSKVVVACGLSDDCLRLFSFEEFDRNAELLKSQLDMSDPEERNIYRYYTAKADKCEFDAQGRIIVSPKMRKFAGINKEVVVIGQGNMAEIWDKEKYEAIFNEEDFNSEKMAAKIKEKKVNF